MSGFKNKIEDIVLPELTAMSVELVDMELSGTKSKNVLRLFIDRAGETETHCTLTIADCEKVSRAVERLLDVEDIFEGVYSLEVSTPGLERALKKLSDYERFSGKMARITLNEIVEGDSFFIGRIKNVDKNDILFELDAKTERVVNINNIKKAKLKFEG